MPSTSVRQDFDLTPWTSQIDELTRALEAKEAEVLRVRDLLSYSQKEAEVKATSAQEKCDELQAPLIELEEKLEICQEDAVHVTEERAEYEVIIRRNDGITISEAEERVKELIPRYREYQSQYGSSSWQFQEQVDELKRIGRQYVIIADWHPILKRLLSSDIGTSSAAGASTSSVPRSTSPIPHSPTQIVDRFPCNFYERERQLWD